MEAVRGGAGVRRVRRGIRARRGRAGFAGRAREVREVFGVAGRTCAAPRLRQSLAALGFGYGLNERAWRLWAKRKTDQRSSLLGIRR